MTVLSVQTIGLTGSSQGQQNLNIDKAINCPYCFSQIETQPLGGLYVDSENIQFFLKCKLCKNSFIGFSKRISLPGRSNEYFIRYFSKGNHKTRKFNEIINNLSESFVKIYGEAEVAEFDKLTEICGIGYRKALEFLIKDYVLSKNDESEHKKIKDIGLSQCITNYIKNENIKNMSKRALWIGNDETHYIRKWKTKDLQDLKKMINITLNYIIMEIEYNEYIEEMD